MVVVYYFGPFVATQGIARVVLFYSIGLLSSCAGEKCSRSFFHAGGVPLVSRYRTSSNTSTIQYSLLSSLAMGVAEIMNYTEKMI